VTATYAGDSNYLGSTATTSFTVNKESTSFTASANPSTATYSGSDSVTITATGLPSNAGGTVTFSDAAGTLCGPASLSGGSAFCSTGELGADAYSVTATYTGDSNYQSSTATTSFTINGAPTSFRATASPAAVPYGTSVTLAANGLPTAASGTVTFTAAGSTLCRGTVSGGSTSCAGDWVVGSYAVLATYSGDSNFLGSTASTSFVVTANPILDLTVSGIPSHLTAGSEYTVTLTAGLSPAGGPAYDDPVITFSLSGPQAFVSTPSVPGWSCSVTVGGTLLTCLSTAVVPVEPGAFLGSVHVTVDVSELATASLQDVAGMVDAADGAVPNGAVEAVSLTAARGVDAPGTGAASGALPWLPAGLGLFAIGTAICAVVTRRRWTARVSGSQG